MIKIELVGIYKINYCRENIKKYKIEGDILYYKEDILCRINYQALINKNKLFVFRDNLIEEYTIKKKREKKKEHKIIMREIFNTKEPINTELINTEDLLNTELVNTELINTELIKTEELINTELIKTELIKTEIINTKDLFNTEELINTELIDTKKFIKTELINTEIIDTKELIKTEESINTQDKSISELPIFRNYESNVCTKDYKEIYNINQITIFKNTKNKKTNLFYKEGKIHLTYLTYLVTLPCKDIIYKFKIERNIVDMTYFSINNKPKSIYKMYLVLSLFLNIKVNVENRETHKFVHELCLFRNSLAKQISFNIFNTSVLVDLYRKIEDKSLIEFDFIKLSFSDMKKVVLLSFTDNLLIFLDKCVSEKRECEINKIIRIFRDTDEFNIIVNWLYKRNCFYYLGNIFGLEVVSIMEIEKCVMMSQLQNKRST